MIIKIDMDLYNKMKRTKRLNKIYEICLYSILKQNGGE